MAKIIQAGHMGNLDEIFIRHPPTTSNTTEVMSSRPRHLALTLSARSGTELELIDKYACNTSRMNKEMTIRDFITMMCPESHNGTISSVETGDGFNCMELLDRSMNFYLDDMYHGDRLIRMIATIDCN